MNNDEFYDLCSCVFSLKRSLTKMLNVLDREEECPMISYCEFEDGAICPFAADCYSQDCDYSFGG